MSSARSSRPLDPIRSALDEAMRRPSTQQAVTRFVAHLVDEAELVLRERLAGETMRIYLNKRSTAADRDLRDQQVLALAQAPTHLTAGQIAAQTGLPLRTVQRVLARQVLP
jgi:hypothetical protein